MRIRHYKFVDYATQGYMALVGLIVLVFGRSLPQWYLLVGAHAAGIALVHGLICANAARPANRFLDLLRHFYPIMLYSGFYRETSVLNLLFVPHFLDEPFIRLEEAIFGFQPSVSLMAKFHSVWISELFYGSYFCYYVMVFVVGLVLYLQGKDRFDHYVSIVSLLFYACYLTYIFLPVVGSRLFNTPVPEYPQDQLVWYPLPYPQSVEGGPFFAIMKLIYSRFEDAGAAFPSSHVALSLCTLYFSWQYIRRIRYVHAAVVVLLMIATVYCRYHYVVDVYAGVLTAIVLLPIGERLYSRYG